VLFFFSNASNLISYLFKNIINSGVRLKRVLCFIDVKKQEGKNGHLIAGDNVYLEVVQFKEESPLIKWALRGFTGLVLAALVVLWAYYR